MTRWYWLILPGLLATPFAACGPDPKPEQPCDGPSFNLVVTAENGSLPADTRINVRYGANHDGEPYALGEKRTPQAVFCEEDTTPGGAPSTSEAALGGAESGAGGAAWEAGSAVHALACRLYTQGPARLDVSATGYEPIEDRPLSFTAHERCGVGIEVKLMPLQDAGL